LYVDALPNTDTAIDVSEDFKHLTRLSQLLRDVLDDQDLIRKIRMLFDKADASEFEDENAYNTFRRRIFQSGIQREVVRLVREKNDIDFLLLKLNSTFRSIPGSRRALETWMANLRQKRSALPDHAARDDEHFDPPERSNLSTKGRGILEQIRSQQSAIEQRLKLRNIPFARKFAADLIRGQKSNSTPEQIAKNRR
jgi:hypothetical protein